MSNEREDLRERVEAMLNGCTYEDCGDEDHETLREVLFLLTQAQEPVAWVNGAHLDAMIEKYGFPFRPMGHEIGDWGQEQEIRGSYSYGETRLRADKYHDRPLYASPVASAPTLDSSLEGVIGFDIHEAIWGPLGEDEAVRPEAWKAAAAVMDILRARASAPEEEREALRISKDMVAFLRASQNRTTSDDPVYVRATPTEAPPENQRCFRCGYLTADATNCPTCAARERGEDDPVFAPTDEQDYPWREPGVSLTNAPTEEQER